MKCIITIIFTCVFASAISAQQNKFNIGIEGGPSLINLRGNGLGFTPDASIGFAGGLTFQYNFPKLLSLRTNIGYERKGAILSNILFTDANGQTLGTTTLHFNFDYFTMPIMLRANFGKKVNFFLNGGIYFGYLIQQKTNSDGTAGLPIPSSEDNTSNYYRFDTGVALGLGCEVPIKNKIVLSFELRNNTGLYNVVEPIMYYSPNLKTSSTNLLIGIAYKFGTRISDEES